MKKQIVALILGGCLAGCAAPPTNYQKNYRAADEVKPTDTLAWLEPGAEAEIVFTEDLATELEARRAEGYVVIGYSQFTGPMEGDKGVRAQARDSRATLVLKSALEAGQKTKYRRVYTRNDGIIYEPIVSEQPMNSEEAVPENPEYARVTVYRQTALFLARRR